MKDYEMYDNDTKLGIINIYWENINNKYKNSIIKSISGVSYEFLEKLDNKDDLYDIVSKYINEDKNRFVEIDKIKKFNNIKKIKKNQIIKIIVVEDMLKCFNLKKEDIDLNSLINAKIYFINKVCEKNSKLKDIKNTLDKIIDNFKNIINSEKYVFYLDNEKDKVRHKALNMLNDLIAIVENKTSYKFGKQFSVPLKINANK